MYNLLSYTALFALWLPPQRDHMFSAIALLMLILLALRCPNAKPAGNKKKIGLSFAAAAVTAVLGWRFVSGWLPSPKMGRLAGMVKLSTPVFLVLLGIGLTLTGFFAVRQLLTALCQLVSNKEAVSKQTPKRLGNIDLIKTLAAALIVLHHYQQSFSVHFEAINFYGGTIEVAWLVELFFMVSGFLMAASDKKTDIPLGRQFVSKCLRFYPSVWLSLTAVLLLMAMSEPDRLRDLSGLTLLSNFFLFFTGWKLNVGMGLNNPTWYLCVLILCYALYYVVKMLCRKCKLPEMPVYFLLGVASIQFMWMDFPLVNNTTLRGYSCFFLGAFLYCVVNSTENKNRLVFGSCLLALSAVGLAVNPQDWNLFVQGLFPAVILLAVTLPQIRSRLVSELGRSSFQLYIWHSPLLRFARYFLSAVNWNSAGKMIAFLLAAELFAYGVYRLFEVPTSHYLQTKLK